MGSGTGSGRATEDGKGPLSERDPVVTITGERVLLGPPARSLVPLLVRWENDLALSLLSGDPAKPVGQEAVEAAFERLFKPPEDEAHFAIYDRQTARPIGLTGLTHIDRAHRKAEFGISIGERGYWGKGYGSEATRLVLDYAFTMLGLHNVFLRVFSFNERAIRAYARAGFREIGRRRESHRIGSRVYDEVLMDCLATDFTDSTLERLLPG